ncbi:MAG: response regulator transcription factor, partial [Propionibacterium sp.]|nr:response regulator transcription factor [Propionibacterium sp.]
VAGGMVIDPRVARSAFVVSSSGPGPLDSLSPSELQVAELVATGASNAEIATALCLAEGTVKNYVSALLRKLDQRDRTRLALLLARLIEPAG